MSNIKESFIHRGYTVEICRDEHAESPRTHFENLGTMYTTHRRYRPEEDFNKHFDLDEVFAKRHTEFSTSFRKDHIALPVYLYDHSGQSVSTTPFSCRWDSGLFGIIAVSVEEVKKEYNWDKITKKRRKQIETYLQGEIETYNSYLHGEVYGFRIENEKGVEQHSCWGYYGDEELEHIKNECIMTIDSMKSRELLEKFKKYGRQLCIPFVEFPELLNHNSLSYE